MCIKSLSPDALSNIKKFKYSSTDSSIFYNYFLSPILNKVVTYLPMTLSPNIITLLGLVFNYVSFTLTQYELGNDFSTAPSRAICLIQFATHFLYIIFDNLDGKQARRTKSSSAFGMLLDHGCDVFTNIIICFNVTHLLQLGNEGPFSYIIFIALLLGFFLLTYEEYLLHELHLGGFNGPDEGNVMVAMGALVGGVFPHCYEWKIMRLSVGKWVALGTAGLTINVIMTSLINIYRSKGYKGIIHLLFDWVSFYSVILVPVMLSIFSSDFYKEYYMMIMIAATLVYARITIDLQIKIVTSQEIENNFTIIIVNVLMYCSLFVTNEILFKTFYLISIFLLAIEIIALVIKRSNEILTCLNLRLLSIVKQNE